MADGDVAGTFRSDMDPQDLPIETATFRGTWETQKGREMMSEFETMQRGCKNVIRAAWHLVRI